MANRPSDCHAQIHPTAHKASHLATHVSTHESTLLRTNQPDATHLASHESTLLRTEPPYVAQSNPTSHRATLRRTEQPYVAQSLPTSTRVGFGFCFFLATLREAKKKAEVQAFSPPFGTQSNPPLPRTAAPVGACVLATLREANRQAPTRAASPPYRTNPRFFASHKGSAFSASAIASAAGSQAFSPPYDAQSHPTLPRT
jgi:hypothetical protein